MLDEPISKRIPNKKHRLFIDELFKNNMNRTAAYMATYPDASYDTARSSAAVLIANHNISDEVEQRLKEKAMSVNEVIARLAEQARGEHTQYILPSGSIDLEGIIEDGKAHLVKGLKYDKEGRLIVEFYDAHAALVDIGKKHGIFSDNLTVKVEGELEKLLDTLQSTLDTDTYNKVVEALADD